MLVGQTKCRKPHGDDSPTSWWIHKTDDDLIVSCVATKIRSKMWAALISGPGIEACTTTSHYKKHDGIFSIPSATGFQSTTAPSDARAMRWPNCSV